MIFMAEVQTGKFIKVRCPDCSNEQITFKNPATNVTCNVCGSTLVKARGGAGELRGTLVEVVD
jgi:small subunit ribosomal protein S27e